MQEPKSKEYCMMALNLSFKCLAELEAIVNHKRNGKKSITDSETFRFYQFSLHYMFVMEVCKLLENYSRGKENFASLKKLNNQVQQTIGNSYKKTFHYVTLEVEQLKDCPIFRKIIYYRDKKLAHSDQLTEIDPLQFKGFSQDDLLECRALLESLEAVLNKCISPFEFVISKNSTTENFIIFHDEYKAFAHSDLKNFCTWKENNKI